MSIFTPFVLPLFIPSPLYLYYIHRSIYVTIVLYSLSSKSTHDCFSKKDMLDHLFFFFFFFSFYRTIHSAKDVKHRRGQGLYYQGFLNICKGAKR